jgi:hypothetical protein
MISSGIVPELASRYTPPKGMLDRLVFGERKLYVSDLDRALHHKPVLGAVVVLLQTPGCPGT